MSIRLERFFSGYVVRLLAGQFVVLGALWPVLPVDSAISMRYAIVAVAIAFGMVMLSAAYRGNRVLLLGVTFAALSALVPILAKGYDGIFLMIVLSVILGFLAYRYYPPPGFQLWLLGGLFLYLIVYYLRYGELDDVFYFEAGYDLAGVSRNYVGILLLQQYLVYYALCIRGGSSPRHWPLFLMPVIAVMASGVGSALATMLALGGFLFYQMRLRLGSVIAVAIAVAVLAAEPLGLLEGTILFDRITSQHFVNSRLLLWSDFANQLDGISIWIGLTNEKGFIDNAATLNEVANLHNSYLNLFKRVGIFSLPYYFLALYTAIALLQRHTMLGWLFVCALLRGTTDGYFFTTFLIDFIIFFLFFMTPLGERVLHTGSNGKSITEARLLRVGRAPAQTEQRSA